MKTIEKIQIEQTRVAGITCELCSRATKDEFNWNRQPFGWSCVTVRWEEGSNYPEGRLVENTILDLCPDCFAQKLVPWFKAQGGKVLEERE